MSTIVTPALDKRLAAARATYPHGMQDFADWIERRDWRFCQTYECNTPRWEPVNKAILRDIMAPYEGDITTQDLGEFIDGLSVRAIDICQYHHGNYEEIRDRLRDDPTEQRKRSWQRIVPDEHEDYRPKGWFPIPLADAPQRLLESYFEIDTEACERELSALIEAQRALNVRLTPTRRAGRAVAHRPAHTRRRR